MSYEQYDESNVKPARKNRKKTRAVKIEQEVPHAIKEKFVEDVIPRPSSGQKIEPRGANQTRMLSALRAGKQIVFGLGAVS